MPSEVPDDGACGRPDTSESPLRRLTRLEYQLTLKELFRLEARPEASALPADAEFQGFNTLASLHNVTAQHLRAYSDTARGLAEQLLEDPERLSAVVGCDEVDAACLQDFTSRFGRLAFRRALSDQEVTSLLSSAELALPSGDLRQRLVFVMEALLSSPSFLFRVEVGDTLQGLSTLSSEQLVTRLSFTLHGRSPSAELLDRAVAGELETEQGLARMADELLNDPRAKEYFDAFFEQWLDFDKMRVPTEPPPGWSDDLLGSMVRETHALLQAAAWGESENLLAALTANHTFVDPPLAEFYGLQWPASSESSGTGPQELVRVEIPAGHPRENSGLLSHAALLSAKNDGDLIAHRGAWLRSTFLCETLSLPSELLATVSDELEGLSYLQVFQKRNTEAACAGCHALIDPIGVGFAQFDALGRFDAEADIAQFEMQPALPGVEDPEFDSLGELAAKLQARAEVASCLSKKLFLYTNGRQATSADECAISRATQQFTSDQYRFASLLQGLVESPTFRLRRPAEDPAQDPAEDSP